MAEKPTMTDYLDAVGVAAAAHPNWREGQTYFNVLRTLRPDLVDEVAAVTGTGADAYTTDRNLPVFLEWLETVW